ncbi:MAG TPA: thioesterase domain-containing protein [Terracidiphilus sp.]|nr:thioesterase domain-containing protein [Terracidiphilus sp.]
MNQSTLVPIQPSGRRPPLYLVHEIFGGVRCYEDLARALGPDQPLYAFRSASEDAGHAYGIEEMASIYVRDLEAFDPAGPHVIGGYSFGGLIAFEMARQLEAKGQSPALVVMLDTFLPGYRTSVCFQRKANLFWENARAEGFRYVARKARNKRDYWARIGKNKLLCVAGSVLESIGCPRPRRVRKALEEKKNFCELASYSPGPYGGSVLHIFCKHRQDILGKSEDDPYFGWGILDCSGFEMCPIPTDHSSLLSEPSLSIVAQNLTRKLPLALMKCQPVPYSTRDARASMAG